MKQLKQRVQTTETVYDLLNIIHSRALGIFKIRNEIKSNKQVSKDTGATCIALHVRCMVRVHSVSRVNCDDQCF